MKPILQTKRLRLIPFDIEDFNLLHNTFINPFIRDQLWDNEIISAETAREILSINEDHFNNDHWGLWKLIAKENDTFIGFAGLWMFFNESQPQLLYGLLPEKTGNGYATEASHAIISYAFHQLQFDYLIAACDTPNEKSKSVCQRLQMKKIEEREINGKWTTFYRLDK